MLLLLLVLFLCIYLNTHNNKRERKTTHPIPMRSHLITTNRLRFYECAAMCFVYISNRKIYARPHVNQIESHFSTISVSFGNAIDSIYTLKAFDTSCKYVCVCMCVCNHSETHASKHNMYTRLFFSSSAQKKNDDNDDD